MIELHQKKQLEKRDFYLEEKKLKIVFEDLNGKSEEFVEYSKISGVHRSHLVKNHTMTGFCIVFGFIVIGAYGFELITTRWMIWAAIFVVFYAVMFLTAKKKYKLIELYDGGVLVFFEDSPNIKAVDEFLSELEKRRKSSIRSKCFFVNLNAEPNEEKLRFDWLKEERIITEDEYEESVSQIKNKFNDSGLDKKNT